MVGEREVFVLPGVIGGDIGRPAAELEDGEDVGFGGVADHEERAGVDFFVREKGSVGLGCHGRRNNRCPDGAGNF